MIRSAKTDNLFSSNDLPASSKCKCDIPYLPILGIFITEFILPSVYYCYGIYFSYSVRLTYYTFHDGLWVTIIFIAARNLTDPWARTLCEYYEDRRNNIHRILIFFSILLFVIGIFISINVGHVISQIVFLGGMGGITLSLVETQIKFTTVDVFESDPKIFDVLINVSRALGLLVMPILNLYLTDKYSVSGAQLILAAIILNVIPASFIMNIKRNQNVRKSLQRYHTFPGLSIQMTEMNLNRNDPADDRPVSSASSVSSDYSVSLENVLNEDTCSNLMTINNDVQTSTSDLTLEEIKEGDTLINKNQITIPVDVTTYYKSIGVNILPMIKEETEDDLNRISLKRLSRISTVLEELNENNKRDSFSLLDIMVPSKYDKNELNTQSYSNENENLYKEMPNNNLLDKNEKNLNRGQDSSVSDLNNTNESTENNQEKVSNNNKQNRAFLKEVNHNKKHSCCCTPYRQYWFKKKVRNSKESLLDNFLKPLYNSIKEIQFYPALTSKVFLSTTSTIFMTIVPFLPYEYGLLGDNKTHEPFENEFKFSLSIIAFPWCLIILLFFVFLIKLSNIKIRIIFVIGLLLNCSSLFIFSITKDHLVLGSFLFGAGYGVVLYGEETVYRNLLGVRRWSKIQGTLETASGIFIIALYLIIYHCKLNLNTLLNLAFFVYASVSLLWIVTLITKHAVVVINKVFCRHGNLYNNREDILY